MNLQSEIREVRSRVSEPDRVNPDNPYFTDLEIIDWIYRAEIQTAHDAIERERLIKTATTAGVASQELYDAPADLLDIVRVTYGGVECTRFPVTELGALATNRLREPTKGLQQFFYELAKPTGVPGRGQIGIRPVPNDTANIVVYYVPMPVRRYKAVQGTTTGAGTTTTALDSVLSAYPDDFWNDTQFRILTGPMRGQFRNVSDFSSGTGTITWTTAIEAAPGTNNDYEMGQVSSLPQEWIPMVVAWASYQALLKDRRPDLASAQRQEYDALLANINNRYGFSRTEPAREAVG